MDHFSYRDGLLYCESVPLDEIASLFGTPCYVYSRAAIVQRWNAFERSFSSHEHLLCYAVKANSNLAILNILARLGSGFDIVSVGELERVLVAGGDPQKVVFSGVGKRIDEMRRALEVGIFCFNVESLAELERLDKVAGGMGCRAPVALRVNPDVDAGTHPYIATGLKESKFGISLDEAEGIYLRHTQFPHICFLGLDCHIGSQLTTLAPLTDALDRMLTLYDRLQANGLSLTHLDMGGGLGIRYQHEDPPTPDGYAAAFLQALGDRPLRLIIEPGRAIVGESGVLLTQVEYLKVTPNKSFAVVDAAMNDLIRPALYDAWHNVEPVVSRTDLPATSYDIVGPVCESGDFLASGRDLALIAGDLLAVFAAGAYGFSMSSNYNTRPRAAEILVDKTAIHCVRKRETVADLYAGEVILPYN